MKDETRWANFYGEPQCANTHWGFYCRMFDAFCASLKRRGPYLRWPDIRDYDLMMIGGGEL